MIREVERCSLRAWPGVELATVCGWSVRASGGYTRRANSANPLDPVEGELRDAVGAVEAWFRTRGLRPVFKLTDAAQPIELDEILQAEGWAREAPAQVMILDISAMAASAVDGALSHGLSHGSTPPNGFHLVAEQIRVPPDWISAFSDWVGLTGEQSHQHAGILQSIRQPRMLARWVDESGLTASVGLAVVDGPWVGLFDLATDPERRSGGLGRALVSALLSWGRGAGATRAYLQVMDQNEGAVRLYGHLGFRIAYPYWYRVASDVKIGRIGPKLGRR